jgi:hypothetical protein
MTGQSSLLHGHFGFASAAWPQMVQCSWPQEALKGCGVSPGHSANRLLPQYSHVIGTILQIAKDI